MKDSMTSKFMARWRSGKFSLWKVSLAIGVLAITSPWLSLIGSKFSLESQLNNPTRSLNIYVNNGLFTFITTLEDGTIRKSSGILGYTNNSFYFLTLSNKYLYIADHSSVDFKRDLINVNNRYFDARIQRINYDELFITYDEEIESEGTQTQRAKVYGKFMWKE